MLVELEIRIDSDLGEEIRGPEGLGSAGRSSCRRCRRIRSATDVSQVQFIAGFHDAVPRSGSRETDLGSGRDGPHTIIGEDQCGHPAIVITGTDTRTGNLQHRSLASSDGRRRVRDQLCPIIDEHLEAITTDAVRIKTQGGRAEARKIYFHHQFAIKMLGKVQFLDSSFGCIHGSCDSIRIRHRAGDNLLRIEGRSVSEQQKGERKDPYHRKSAQYLISHQRDPFRVTPPRTLPTCRDVPGGHMQGKPRSAIRDVPEP